MTTIEVAVPDGMTAGAVRRLIDEIASSRTASARVAAAMQRETNPPGPGVAAQIAAVEALWRHLIDTYGTYTSADIAKLRGADPKNRSVATSLAKTHHLISFTRRGSRHYPTFEFKGGEPHPNWKPLIAPLVAADWDDDDILLWLVSPHPALSGREPAEFIDTSHANEAVAVATNDARGTW